MKKIISAAVCALTVLSCFSLSAGATNDNETKLPFTLETPSKLSLSYLEGDDSPTTMSLAYSMNDSMCKWMSYAADPTTHDEAMEKLLKEYKLEDIYVNIQIDWAIDDPENGWHYTKYWDGETFKNDDGKTEWAGFGHDKEYQSHVGAWDIVEAGIDAQSVNNIWVTRGITVYNNPEWTEEEYKENNQDFLGTDLIPGLKDQLKEDQYTLIETDPESHEQMIKIDYTKHTAYVRARYAITLCDADGGRTPVFTEWSEAAGSGKDAQEFKPLTKEELAPPVISDLRYYTEEFNGYPQIACTLDVPKEIIDKKTEISAHGGEIRVEWEGRSPEGEWVGLQGGVDVTAGESIIALQNLGEWIVEQNKIKGEGEHLVLEKDSPVELRARYWCSQKTGYNGEEIGEFYSDYSKVLTFGSQEMSTTIEAAPSEAEVSDEDGTVSKAEPEKGEDEKAKCSVCGICPVQPLGICLFIWIAIIVVIIVIVIVVTAVKKKKNKK